MAVAAFVINNGKQLITGRMTGFGNEPKFIQWGTGTATALVSDTGLQSTAGTSENRANGSTSQVTGAQTLSAYRITGAIVALGTPTIAEVAVFDGAGAGNPPVGANCFVHASHASQALALGESITYIILVDFTP